MSERDFDFSKLAANYDKGFTGKASKRFYNLLLHEIDVFSNAKVMDAGCGTGKFLKILADTCDIAGYGIDVEENMIAVAKSNCPDFSFQESQCDKTPFEDSEFDIVVACMAYHHFENKQAFAKEAARIIKPGGVLYIADPRFPWPIRKAINGVLRLVRITGAFYNHKEIETQFSAAGFVGAGFAYNGYAQVIKLRRG